MYLKNCEVEFVETRMTSELTSLTISLKLILLFYHKQKLKTKKKTD